MKIALEKKVGKGFPFLIPYDDEGMEQLSSLNDGKYVIELKKARNPEFHNKFMAMVRVMFENQEAFNDFDEYRDYILISIGYFTWINVPPTKKNPEGTKYPKSKSISFESMDDLEFRKVYNKVVDFGMRTYGFDESMFKLVAAFA